MEGRPVSAVTSAFLAWCAERAQEHGKRAILVIWDNASWHDSQIVRTWVRQHNRQVKQSGHGVWLVVCYLPTKSPWLNPIEPKWLHGKKRVDHIWPPTASSVRLHCICADVDRVRDGLTATTQAVEARSNGPCAGVLS